MATTKKGGGVESWQEAIDDLERRAARTTDPDIVATLLAASDDGVRALIAERIKSGCLCLGVESDGSSVHFRFTHPPGRFAFVPASFVATVDLRNKRVIGVGDSVSHAPSAHAVTPMLATATAPLGVQPTRVRAAIAGGFSHVGLAIDGYPMPLVGVGPNQFAGQADIPIVSDDLVMDFNLYSFGTTTLEATISVPGCKPVGVKTIVPTGHFSRSYTAKLQKAG
jgi:hypothetical protein